MCRITKIIIIGTGATRIEVASKLLREGNDLNIHVYQNDNIMLLEACVIPYFIANNFKDAKLLISRTKTDYQNL